MAFNPINNNNRTGSGFVNLQKILQANQGNRLGQSVLGGVQNQAQQLQNKASTASQQFHDASNAAFKPFEGGTEFGQTAIQKAQDTVNNQDDLNRFQTIRSGQYSGPMGINDQDTEALASGVAGLNTSANIAKSFGGRQALLSNQFQHPTYSGGQRRLDAMLLQTDPQQASRLNNIRQVAAQTGRQVGSANVVAGLEAQAKQRAAQDMGDSLSTQLTNARNSADQAARDKLAATQKTELGDYTTGQLGNQEIFQNTENDLKQGNISYADAQRLGLVPLFNGQQEISTYGVNPLKYLNTYINAGAGGASTQDVISQDDALRANALSKMAGMGQVYDPSTVGKFRASSQNFSPEALQSAIQKGQEQVGTFNQQKEAFNKEIFQPLNRAMALSDKFANGTITPSETTEMNLLHKQFEADIRRGKYGTEMAGGAQNIDPSYDPSMVADFKPLGDPNYTDPRAAFNDLRYGLEQKYVNPHQADIDAKIKALQGMSLKLGPQLSSFGGPVKYDD